LLLLRVKLLLLSSKLLLGSKLLLRSKLLLGSKLLLRGKLLLLLRSKLLLRGLPLLLLSLSKELVKLSLSQLRSRGRLSSRRWGNRLRSAELRGTALRLECLLSLLELLWLLGSKLLLRDSWLKMSRQRINLTITIFISRKSFKSNLFSSQLRNRCQSRLLGLGGKLLLLLRSKLLLGESRLLLSRGKLLGILSKLLVLSKLRAELAWLLGKLLLWLLGKLLLRLLGKLLWLLSKLLSLLELLEVLVKVLCIELF